MKVTVCELGDSVEGFARDWDRLVAHVQEHRGDLVLLPEMPFPGSRGGQNSRCRQIGLIKFPSSGPCNKANRN